MSYLYDLPNATSGADAIALQMFDSFPFLGSLILFFIFMVVFLGGITRQKLKTGTADYSAWGIIASISTLLPALILSITSGFIQADWLIIVVALNLLCAIWFFLDRKASEV